jgi:rhodanese-related sulfurtransferase
MFERLLGLKSISPSGLQQMMQNQPVTVFDVNSRHSWDSAHVPGAVPLDPVSYGEADLPANRDSVLVFYCSNFLCRKAPIAACRAKSMGFRNVYVMSAGISGWVGTSLPTESGQRVG